MNSTSRELRRFASELKGKESTREAKLASIRDRVRAQIKTASKQNESSPVSAVRQRIATRRAITAVMELVAGTLTKLINEMFAGQLEGKELDAKEAMKFLNGLSKDLQNAVAAKFKDANKKDLEVFFKAIDDAVDAIQLPRQD